MLCRNADFCAQKSGFRGKDTTFSAISITFLRVFAFFASFFSLYMAICSLRGVFFGWRPLPPRPLSPKARGRDGMGVDGRDGNDGE